MEQAKIERINELARKAKEGPLTDAETRERAQLRREYLAAVTGSLQRQLDSIVIVEPDGQRRKLKKVGSDGQAKIEPNEQANVEPDGQTNAAPDKQTGVGPDKQTGAGPDEPTRKL